MAELTRGEKDILILSMICSHVNRSEMTMRQRQKNEPRQRSRMREFMFEDKRVCRFGFIYLFDTSLRTFNTLKKHYEQHGLVPRTLKSGELICHMYC